VKADYTYPVYCTDVAALIGKLGAETVDWLGTSMGGIIGMILASLPGSPVRKLGAERRGLRGPEGGAGADPAIRRARSPSFESAEALEQAMRAVSPFGELTDEQWRHLAVTAAKQDEKGRWIFRYDPGIAEPFAASPSPTWTCAPTGMACADPRSSFAASTPTSSRRKSRRDEEAAAHRDARRARGAGTRRCSWTTRR
jgi:pimeloyl-ACP methyl ester carboxylesterase